MSAGPEIVERQPAVVGTSNGNGSTRGDGADVIKRGIDLLRYPELNKSIAFTETCPTCGGPLTQGECLRCLLSLGFLSDSQQPDKVENGRRLMPGPLKYDHFEVEVGADGFPVELGAGAMAITYRARDTVLNSTVALKVIDRTVAQNPGARSRFLREARAAAQIRHPNVARVSHYGEQEGECFYVMELVEGETLEAKVRREGPMPLALALEVIEQAARALAAAEACGVVHRDIKPSNIMLESDPSGALIVKVIDYGIAKTRRRKNSVWFHRNSGVRESRAVRSFGADENRHAFGHLFVRRDLLVFAQWPRSFCWSHAGRSARKTN